MKSCFILIIIWFVVSEIFFLVEWKDEGAHSVISARDLQDPTCAPNLKKGADVNVVERRTKRVYTAVILASGEAV